MLSCERQGRNPRKDTTLLIQMIVGIEFSIITDTFFSFFLFLFRYSSSEHDSNSRNFLLATKKKNKKNRERKIHFASHTWNLVSRNGSNEWHIRSFCRQFPCARYASEICFPYDNWTPVLFNQQFAMPAEYTRRFVCHWEQHKYRTFSLSLNILKFFFKLLPPTRITVLFFVFVRISLVTTQDITLRCIEKKKKRVRTAAVFHPLLRQIFLFAHSPVTLSNYSRVAVIQREPERRLFPAIFSSLSLSLSFLSFPFHPLSFLLHLRMNLEWVIKLLRILNCPISQRPARFRHVRPIVLLLSS